MTRLKKENLFIALFFVVAFLIIFGIMLCLHFRPLNQTKIDALYEQSEQINKDFKSVSLMDNVTITPKDGKYKVVFKGEECSLVTTYDINFNLIKDEIQDTRLCADMSRVFVLSVAFTVMSPAFVMGIFLIFVLPILAITDKIREKKKEKNQEKVH